VTSINSTLIFDHDQNPGRPEVTVTTREKTIGTILDASFNRSEDLMDGTVR
jgi:hypothetical protein